MDLQQIIRALGTVDQLYKGLNHATAEQLQTLLETKHLYQRVLVDAVGVLAAVRDRNLPSQRGEPVPEGATTLLAEGRLIPHIEETKSMSVGAPALILRNSKLYCLSCDGREAFRPVWSTEITDIRHPTLVFAGSQLFALGYQCQRCLGPPVGFLVRRQGWHLILEGRSPMEKPEIPTFIPRKERHFFENAIVAMNAGKALAAIFYLRSFIEQFARRLTGMTGKTSGDEIMAAYGETLPIPQRDQMPSLREWYGRLSENIHAASEDPAAFEAAREAIETHFDIRRVYKIDESVPKKKAEATFASLEVHPSA